MEMGAERWNGNREIDEKPQMIEITLRTTWQLPNTHWDLFFPATRTPTHSGQCLQGNQTRSLAVRILWRCDDWSEMNLWPLIIFKTLMSSYALGASLQTLLLSEKSGTGMTKGFYFGKKTTSFFWSFSSGVFAKFSSAFSWFAHWG